MSFEDLKLSSWLIRQCRNLNFTRPTAVQQACVPAILNDEDVYAAAKTGSGKTAAFALPILEQLSHDPYGVYAVVLTPTRELAFQISDQFQSLGKPIGVRVATIVGGIDSIKQAVELSRRPHIIVATPGRLASHIEDSTQLDLSMVHTLVLDEADRLMTNETLQGHLDVILDALPEERQNLLFSATLLEEPSGKISQQLHRDLFRYSEIKEEATVTTLRQRYVFLPAHMRFPYLIHILRQLHDDKNNSIVLFVPTCRLCEELALTLRELDLRCTALHSQMSQKARLDALHKFKSSFIHILLATDVASRGLDIPTVTYVINYNVPRAPEDYVHRVGRTARAGRGGMAITLMDERDIELLQAIEEHINVKLTAYDDIKDEEIVQSMNKINIARRAAELQLLESGFDERLQARKAKLASRKAAANDDESAGSEDQTMPPGKRTKGQKSSKSASQPATPKTGASKPQRRRNSKTPQKA